MDKQVERYVASTELPVSVDEAFAYHERAGALQRLIPPWESAQIEHSDHSLAVGSKVTLRSKVCGIPVRWLAEHTHYDPPHLFADTQVSGPFARWDHRHQFVAAGDDRSTLTDTIEYELPLGAAGRLFGGGMARRMIESMFAYRHRVTRDDLTLLNRYPTTPLQIAVSGSSGLVGQQLCSMLGLLGHEIKRIVRSPTEDADRVAVWSADTEASKLDGVDAIVHLAGKSIASQRWSDAVKQQIRESRVEKTRQLCEKLAGLPHKPNVLICASAIGIYGDRGDELLSEESPLADDFLAGVAREWEHACQPAKDAGIRVVNARLGLVLSPNGGALQKMLLPAKLFGGSLGSGRQWCSWIALDDVLGAIYHAIQTESLCGPINLVSPEPVINREFAKTLGRVLGKPALVPAPAFALRLALGEMADALLLASARVRPSRLLETNYDFRFTDLAAVLRYYLGRDRLESSG
jgi:uncharacterized protein (TIGR01777 family)